MNRRVFIIALVVLIGVAAYVGWQYFSNEHFTATAVISIEDREERAIQTLLAGKVELVTIESEVLSDFWKSSGALDKGYSLDEYTEAVGRLNPEREDVTTFVSGMTELRVITKVTLARPE